MMIEKIADCLVEDHVALLAENKALREALAEQAEQEPVSQKPVVKIHQYNEFQTLGSLNLPIGTKLYAAPVRTKDLTDDEIDVVVSQYDEDQTFEIARAVIAADREKNK